MIKTAELHHSKTTVGTYVYMEPADKPRAEQVFPTIYIQKSALSDPPPAKIRVTIEVA